jgi:hypothetical protein
MSRRDMDGRMQRRQEKNGVILSKYGQMYRCEAR